MISVITCYGGPLMCGGPGVSPMNPPIYLALQSSPQVYDYPANCSWFCLRTNYNKITLHAVMMWLSVTIMCFKIENHTIVSALSHFRPTVQLNIVVWFKAVSVVGANRFHWTVFDIINYNNVTSATNSYVFLENVKNFFSIILILITYWTPLI